MALTGMNPMPPNDLVMGYPSACGGRGSFAKLIFIVGYFRCDWVKGIFPYERFIKSPLERFHRALFVLWYNVFATVFISRQGEMPRYVDMICPLHVAFGNLLPLILILMRCLGRTMES